MSKKHRKRRNAVLEPHNRPLTLGLITPPKPVVLRPIEDRRLYHPLGPVRPARQLTGHPVKPNLIKVTRKKVMRSKWHSPLGIVGKGRSLAIVGGVPSRIRFAVPAKTVICVKRKVRTEVLHAFKKTGRGVSRKRHSRRNFHSAISC